MFSTLDSLAFLLNVRKVLSEVTDITDLKPEEKIIVKNYFIDEATDYEVIHFFLRGSFPKEKYDTIKEAEEFDVLRGVLRRESASLCKHIDPACIKYIIDEVGPISEKGLSSATPVLEFLMNSGYAELLREDYDDGDVVRKREKIAGKVATAAKAAGKVAGKAATVAKKGAGVAAAGAKKVAGVTVSIAKQARILATRGVGPLVGFFRSKKGRYAGAAMIAALVAFAGYQVYKRKFSPAAKACVKLQGPEKSACVKKFKVDALNAQLATLRQGLSACPTSKDPDQCRKALEGKIKSLATKIAKASK